MLCQVLPHQVGLVALMYPDSLPQKKFYTLSGKPHLQTPVNAKDKYTELGGEEVSL